MLPDEIRMARTTDRTVKTLESIIFFLVVMVDVVLPENLPEMFVFQTYDAGMVDIVRWEFRCKRASRAYT